jgi:hypothetical protein
MCTRIAMGAALDLNPLVVLGATIGAGCIFGTMGLILAAPLLSAAVHITKRLGHARAAAGLEPAQLANEARSAVGESSGAGSIRLARVRPRRLL